MMQDNGIDCTFTVHKRDENDTTHTLEFACASNDIKTVVDKFGYFLNAVYPGGKTTLVCVSAPQAYNINTNNN